MPDPRRVPPATLLLAAAVLAAGCGSTSSNSSRPPATSKASAAPTPSATSTAGERGSALAADATSAATGDIPDNQVFLAFHNAAAGYAMKYPEGWTQHGSGNVVTFQDKNNLVRVTVAGGAAMTLSSVRAELTAARASSPSLTFTPPQTVSINARAVIRSVYRTQSAPNPVTGKRVLLIVDRYVVSGPGRHAVVDLGTPRGVDNVDAYRLMIESFAWR